MLLLSVLKVYDSSLQIRCQFTKLSFLSEVPSVWKLTQVFPSAPFSGIVLLGREASSTQRGLIF